MTVPAAVAAQNAHLPPSAAREANLRALAAGAPAVVTGQQVGLFLGPLYTIYKAATAIRLARVRGAVPIFWLQTEDHDLVEIARVACPGRTVEVPAAPEARVAIAHCALPPEVEGALAELGAELSGHVGADAHLERLARHYRPGARWSDAFAGVMAELFAPEGLVFVDPRDPALAAAARPVHERALADFARIAAALRPGQVHVRPGAPLSYFHPDGPEGPRYRLEPCGPDAFAEVRGRRTHRLAELRLALDAEPRAMSTSALLRPIVQDTLLRTEAYVGGPAEVAYFAQIEALWPLFDLPQPRVVRRSSFRLVPAAARRQLDRLGLAPADLERPEDELLARAPHAGLPRGILDSFEAALAEIQAPELARPVERTRRSVGRAVAALGRKVERAALHRDAERVERVRRLKNLFHPGAPQERVYGLPWFAARHGDREVVARALAAVDLGDPGLKDVELS